MQGNELRRVESFRRFARDPNGNITQSLREDASCWYYAYDGLQRLTAAEWKDSGGVSLYAFEYAYDKVGNRTHIVANGLATYYSYNAANELTLEETPDASETIYYIYDGRGNQTQRQVLGGQTLYFDYNSRNLVSGIWNTDPTFTPNYFEYNALGQRIKKVDSTGTTRYLWDGLNILLETDASGNLTRRYTHGYSPIEGVSSLIAVEGPIQCPCFYHFDQVGGVRHLTDPYHNTIKSYAYEPFGRILAESGSAPNDFTFPATYIGLPRLPDLRLSPSRLYEARSGRFASRGRPGRGSAYGFPGLDTTRVVDPSGWDDLPGTMTWDEWRKWRDQTVATWKRSVPLGGVIPAAELLVRGAASGLDALAPGLIAPLQWWLPKADPENNPWDFFRCWTEGLLPREIRFDERSRWTQHLKQHDAVRSAELEIKKEMQKLCDAPLHHRWAEKIEHQEFVRFGLAETFSKFGQWYEYMLGSFELKGSTTKEWVGASRVFPGAKTVVAQVTFTLTNDMTRKSLYAILGAVDLLGGGVEGMRERIVDKTTPGPMMSVHMVFKWTNVLIAECCAHELERIMRHILSPYARLVQ